MEAILNKYFAHSHQKVLGTLAAYAGLIYLAKAKLSGPKTPKPETPPTEVPAVSRASGSSKYGFDVPTLENFDEWASKEDNLKKWEEWVTKEDNLEKWLKAE